MNFGLNNLLDYFRVVFSSITRDLRVLDERKVKTQMEEAPLELIAKFNSLFDFYFNGKLPDEYKYMLLDQKDILRPLLSIIWDLCISKVDLFMKVSVVFDENISCEMLKLLANSIRYRHDCLSSKEEEEFCALADPIIDFIEDRLLVALGTGAQMTSFMLIPSALMILYRVVAHSPGDTHKRRLRDEIPLQTDRQRPHPSGSLPVAPAVRPAKRHTAQLDQPAALEEVRVRLGRPEEALLLSHPALHVHPLRLQHQVPALHPLLLHLAAHLFRNLHRRTAARRNLLQR